jgi:ribonuclease HII
MDYSYEKKLNGKGFEFVCGIDEAGRGPLAGPLLAGAVILDPLKLDFLSEIKDSKLLDEKKREELFPIILANVKAWAIGVARQDEIDSIGLGLANRVAMKRAWMNLPIEPNYILVDYMPKVFFNTPFELIVKGDRTILTIAAASIIAKVFHDRMMDAFARKYPQYGFELHKGYGTKLHLDKIKEFGACPIHRRSFAPLKPKLF